MQIFRNLGQPRRKTWNISRPSEMTDLAIFPLICLRLPAQTFVPAPYLFHSFIGDWLCHSQPLKLSVHSFLDSTQFRDEKSSDSKVLMTVFFTRSSCRLLKRHDILVLTQRTQPWTLTNFERSARSVFSSISNLLKSDWPSSTTLLFQHFKKKPKNIATGYPSYLRQTRWAFSSNHPYFVWWKWAA